MVKQENLFLVLLFASLLFFVPLLEPPQEISVLPGSNSVVYDVHTPKIKLSTTSTSQMVVNVTFLEVKDETSTIIYTQIEFTKSTTIETDKAGLYLLEILATEPTIVKMQGSGIHRVSIVIVSIIGIINLYNLSKKLTHPG